MKQWQRIIAVCAASMGLGLLSATPALAADVAKDLVLKGDAKCTKCHDEADGPELLAIGKTKHGTRADDRAPTCTSCHGESVEHLGHKGSGKPPKPDRIFSKSIAAEARNDACLGCHQKDSKRSHWVGSTHETREVACSSCHKVHTAKDQVRDKRTQAEVCFTCHKEQRTQYQRPSRHAILEGKISCSDCHNVHGSIGPKLLKRDSTVETCYQCHMEKRGPFVRSHEPVNEDCGNCHTPHGSNAEFMLKARPPFLCNECHSPHGAQMPQIAGQSAAATPLGKNAVTYTQGRGCVNCHTQVHGSNNPSRSESPTPQYLLR